MTTPALRVTHHRKALNVIVIPDITKFQYTDGVSDISRVSPDNWIHDPALLDRPGNCDIQMDLFYDYRTNLPLYPAVQQYFRDRQPPTIIVWGKNDKIFSADGAFPNKRDLPNVEFHLIDTGHFALEDKADEIVPLIRDFLGRKLARVQGILEDGRGTYIQFKCSYNRTTTQMM
jgi:pimeloyl-ACP methyl ester carboxylesterase